MKHIIFIIFSLMILNSCKDKKVSEDQKIADRKLEIDSINAIRTKYNDSILVLRNKNKHQDLTGSHLFTMSSHGISTLKGTVNFKKSGSDVYEISGKATSGSNTITIKGTAELVKPEYLNFAGAITQNISENGRPYTRNGEKTFAAKGEKQFWRLQDRIKSEGFVDYIDIHFK